MLLCGAAPLTAAPSSAAHLPQVSVEEFELDARAAVATQAERDKEVLQKLLTVKDQMIWCAQGWSEQDSRASASAGPV